LFLGEITLVKRHSVPGWQLVANNKMGHMQCPPLQTTPAAFFGTERTTKDLTLVPQLNSTLASSER
jgi:hypothetical protein